MAAVLGIILRVRSEVAEDLRRYYESAIERLDRTPWHRGERVIRATQVAISIRVLKEDTSPPGDRQREDDHSRGFVDPEAAPNGIGHWATA